MKPKAIFIFFEGFSIVRKCVRLKSKPLKIPECVNLEKPLVVAIE